MVDKHMNGILDRQERINKFLSSVSREDGNQVDLRREFAEYCKMLKSSIFRAEAFKILRVCQICENVDLEAFAELKCTHFVCESCVLDEKNRDFDDGVWYVNCKCSQMTSDEEIFMIRANYS